MTDLVRFDTADKMQQKIKSKANFCPPEEKLMFTLTFCLYFRQMEIKIEYSLNKAWKKHHPMQQNRRD